jgi:hypothetical protein
MMKLTDAVDLSLGRKPKYYKGNTSNLIFPTPTASMWEWRGHSNHDTVRGFREVGIAVGKLNPTWVEWLMGFPHEHTDLSALETPSSPKLPNDLEK